MIAFLLLLSVSLTGVQGDPEPLATGCSSHCTLDYDKNLDCWQRTLEFYEQILLGQLRQYIVVQTGIAHWKINHSIPVNFNDAASATVARMKHIEPGNAEDEDGIIDVEDYATIVKELVDKSQFWVDNDIVHAQKPPALVCPLGCEKDWQPFFWMFLVSAGVNLMLGAASMTLVFLLDRRDTRLAKLELAEYENVKLQNQPGGSVSRTT